MGTGTGIIAIFLQKIVDSNKISIKSNWVELTGKNLDVIKSRGVLDAINSPKNWKMYYNKSNKRIVIPWLKNHTIEYYQERATSSKEEVKYIYPKDLKKPIFNIDRVTQDCEYVFATEGAFDCVFIKNGIAIGTTSFTEHQQEILKYELPQFTQLPKTL